MIFGGVVGDERKVGGKGGKRRAEDVGFSGVEITAARVNAKGPRGVASSLPGGERKGVVQEAGEGGVGDGLRWSWERGGEEGEV